MHNIGQFLMLAILVLGYHANEVSSCIDQDLQFK